MKPTRHLWELADDMKWSLHASQNELYGDSFRQTFADYHKRLLDSYEIGGIFDEQGRELARLIQSQEGRVIQ